MSAEHISVHRRCSGQLPPASPGARQRSAQTLVQPAAPSQSQASQAHDTVIPHGSSIDREKKVKVRAVPACHKLSFPPSLCLSVPHSADWSILRLHHYNAGSPNALVLQVFSKKNPKALAALAGTSQVKPEQHKMAPTTKRMPMLLSSIPSSGLHLNVIAYFLHIWWWKITFI